MFWNRIFSKIFVSSFPSFGKRHEKSSSPFFITSQSNVEPEIQILKVIYKTHLSELQWAALPESNTACSSTSGQEFLSLPPPTAQCMATLYFAYWKTVGNQLAAVVMKVKLTSFCYSVLSFGYALPTLTYLISEPVCLTKGRCNYGVDLWYNQKSSHPKFYIHFFIDKHQFAYFMLS